MNKAKWIGSAVALLISVTAKAAVTRTEDLVNQQDRPWQPAAPAVQMPLWPEGLAIAPPTTTSGKEAFRK